MDIHPAANSFPMMPQDRFDDLKADIGAHGQREDITLCDGLILDGRNRYRACMELGIEPKARTFGGNPWTYVWSLNGQRRDLSQDQRAQIWIFVNAQSAEWEDTRQRIADEANAKRSEKAKEQPRTETGFAEKQVDEQSVHPPAPKQAKARKAKAGKAGVNSGAIMRAEALQATRPDLAEKVRTGEVKPAEARRQATRDAVADKVQALPVGQFTVIYADPPWSYNDKCDDGAVQAGGVEKHYPAMSLTELKALAVPSASDAVLFLWATSPLLPEALELSQAWGFRYKASFVWDKIKHNMGHYNSVRHEFLLVCVKGNCTPQNVKLYDSVQSVERTAHSEKPETFREIIETLYPHGARLEMFGRKQTKGWITWGNQAQ